MNTRKKIFIVNNQEDEDGDNLYSWNADINRNVKRECDIFSLDHSQNKKNSVVKLPAHRSFVSDNVPGIKSK